MLINRANLMAMFRGFQMTFQGSWQQAPSMWEQFATLVPSTGTEEQYGWLATMPRFREWLGDRVIQSLGTHDYTIKNKPFELTIGVNKDHIEDDKIGVYKPLVEQLGFESKTHPDELIFGAFLAGSGAVCYDGQYFFDTDHPVVAADGSVGSWSNWGGGGAAQWFLLDLSRPLKPVVFQKRKDYDFVAMTEMTDEAVFMRKEFRMGVDARLNVGYGLPHLAYSSKQTLDLTAYKTARAGMRGLKGDGGKVLNVNPGVLLVPPSLEGAALDIAKAERLANGATNVMRDTCKVVVAPWLA